MAFFSFKTLSPIFYPRIFAKRLHRCRLLGREKVGNPLLLRDELPPDLVLSLGRGVADLEAGPVHVGVPQALVEDVGGDVVVVVHHGLGGNGQNAAAAAGAAAEHLEGHGLGGKGYWVRSCFFIEAVILI